MFAKKLLIGFSLLYFPVALHAQNSCTTLGQTPATAFPVCGSDTFTQTTVPACVNGDVPVIKCSTPAAANIIYQDLNPYWYKFTCFTAGTLGLTIIPNNLDDDYDWQLFDVTNHDPSEVYSNTSLIIGSNWSGITGITGTRAGETSLFECATTSLPATGPPIFSSMPSLIQGHNYLLLISHFTGDSQSGYKLSFLGGTASITDTTPPALRKAQTSCDGTKVTVLLNKRMKCGSMVPDGSDFSLSPSAPSIVSASANGCRTGFDMDSVVLTLNGALAPGDYTVTARLGTDDNTLLDNCGAAIPTGTFVSFTKPGIPPPTPLDSITPPRCAPTSLQLVFSKRIHCNSLAPDGSDFTVTGPSAVTVSGIAMNCDEDDESNIIQVLLSGPIVVGGTYQITLKGGTDGNSIIDECGVQSVPGSSLFFFLKDTVSAAFNELIQYGCRLDTLFFSNPPANGIDQWQWIFNNKDTSLLQGPKRSFSSTSTDTIQLIVSNGFCSDTAKNIVVLDNGIHAAFEGPDLMCPKDPAEFRDKSTGPVNFWNWDFGDGSGSSFQAPPGHQYPLPNVEVIYPVVLVVESAAGCRDTITHKVDVLRSCYIAVPSAFTPNGDGSNDYLYPLNAYKADDLEFRVYNRYGQKVFESREWTKKWDGTVGGHPQPAGTFVWTLQYTDRDSGRKFFQKGFSVLIR
ncbi:MAG TPA: gliding motility-associated C-terminal domain-containing protein [Puia sp.]|nr:gliding motility-associated C-terminal domain-containing protein [Puia sp.]